jgi:peroxiredoxin Q/BCP
VLQAALVNVGDTAPAFSLKDSKGNVVSLKDFSGKSLVMWFFPKADTPG